MAEELTAEKAQNAVDEMAKVLGKAETALERALMLLGEVPKAIHDFHNAIGTHVTYVAEAHELAAVATSAASSSLRSLSEAHESLNGIREARKLPPPGAVALNGGGQGKP